MPDLADETEVVEAFRRVGDRFAFVPRQSRRGNRACELRSRGRRFGDDPPAAWEVAVPDDPATRVEWVATTRKNHAGECSRLDLARQSVLEESCP